MSAAPSARSGETGEPRTYGGQAVIEGVLIRGQRTLALACRRPDGAIYRYREPLDSPLQRPGPARLPLVRGVVVLWESLKHGTRMLMRSADIQLEEEEHKLGTGGNVAVMVTAGVAAVALFVGVPYVATGLLHPVASDLVLNVIEGALRLVLLVGYLFAISFMPEIRRVFAYHGAEHMTIHAYEHGEPLEVGRIAPYPTAHPRCGTAFLLLVVFVAVALFAFLPRTNVVVDLVVRLLLVIPVAAISYEVLRFGARHERRAAMRLLIAPGLLLQRITTRRPDESMIEVAVASLEEALAGDAVAESAP
ncbi:MAG: DUF1385 domain-containing protein [Candidatus Limnocylindria bacterium]